MTTPEPRSSDRQDDLERHRRELRDAALVDVIPRLEKRGIRLDGAETSDELATLLSTVEEFEAVVAAHGGDSMLNDRTTKEPEDDHFVLPERKPGERIGQYIWRITEAQRNIGRAD